MSRPYRAGSMCPTHQPCLATEILDVQGAKALTVWQAGDDVWVETNDWRATVDAIVDATLTRVSILEMRKALFTP